MGKKLNVERSGGWWEVPEVVEKAMEWVEGESWGLQVRMYEERSDELRVRTFTRC